MTRFSIVSHFEGIAFGIVDAMARGRAVRLQAALVDLQSIRTLDRVATVARAMHRDRQELGRLREENARLLEELAEMRARTIRAEAVAIRDRAQP